MKKMHIPLLLSLYLLLSACRICDEKPNGKYSCFNSDNAINYIEFKSDGTYYHIFEKENRKLENKGIWKMSNDDKCIVELYDYNNFNEKDFYYDEYSIYLLWINNKYLDHTPDGETSTSFVKD